MATKRGLKSYDFSEDVVFKPLVDNLREASNDDTPLTDRFVSFYRNVYDMIDGSDDNISDKTNCIVDIKFDYSCHQMMVYYKNGTVKTIKIEDNYLFSASFNKLNGIASFILSNGQVVRLNLNDLKDIFYEKKYIDEKIEQIEMKIDEKDSLKWNKF